ncbi:MAG: hypothetical protein QME05_06515 [Candidatus Margulisbacteria bacterium]|nr:hypothetical protein [Candidatus Margulisiibacteriota bacterium]
MKYQEFKKKLRKLPLFSSSQLGALGGNVATLKNQLVKWQKKGLLIKLRRGLYLLNQDDREMNPSRFFIACQLYPPCYISTTYALSYYGIIPEAVRDVTCVTTRKTASFDNPSGRYVYQHLKKALFGGFHAEKDENGMLYFIADKEKALVDYIYFNLKAFAGKENDIFEKSHRFKKESGLNPKKLKGFAALAKNRQLEKVISQFCQYLRQGR